jgi:hypothetical protein
MRLAIYGRLFFLLFTVCCLLFTSQKIYERFFVLTLDYLLPDYLPSSKGAYCANDLCSC